MSFRSARLAADKGVSEVAKLMGVSRQSVWNWERGAVYPEAAKLTKLARLFNCSVDCLLTEDSTTEDVQ